MPLRRGKALIFSLVAAAALPIAQSISGPTPAIAERRSEENAVTSAEDAFGFAAGREQLGLYGSQDVRGFSPLAAGNARIEGLYFDPVAEPNSRLAASTTIRVGLSAQSAPLIAPTGIVDYGLRLPGNLRTASILAGADGWGSASIEADAAVPLDAGSLSLGLGGAFGRLEFGDGTRETINSQGLILRWRPDDEVDATSFWSRSEARDATPSAVSISDDALPPLAMRRRFDGPAWARVAQTEELAGLIFKGDIAPGLLVSIGAFHSHQAMPVSFSLLRKDFEDDGFRQVVIAEPPKRTSSNSGEARLTRVFRNGDQQHQVHVSLRERDRAQSYGGGDIVDLGRFEAGGPIDVPRPDFNFGPSAHDRVRQQSLGLAYQGRFGAMGTAGISLQRTRYRKHSQQPGAPIVRSRSREWLLSGGGTLQVMRTVSLYGSYAEGLEESEPAPTNAVNRGEPVPAIRTRQLDAGLRWQITPGLSAVLGAFQLDKPYFSLNSDSQYARLGTIRNRGVELSLAGALTPRMNIVAGTLLQDPIVIGREAEEGDRRPSCWPADAHLHPCPGLADAGERSVGGSVRRLPQPRSLDDGQSHLDSRSNAVLDRGALPFPPGPEQCNVPSYR